MRARRSMNSKLDLRKSSVDEILWIYIGVLQESLFLPNSTGVWHEPQESVITTRVVFFINGPVECISGLEMRRPREVSQVTTLDHTSQLPVQQSCISASQSPATVHCTVTQLKSTCQNPLKSPENWTFSVECLYCFSLLQSFKLWLQRSDFFWMAKF